MPLKCNDKNSSVLQDCNWVRGTVSTNRRETSDINCVWPTWRSPSILLRCLQSPMGFGKGALLWL